MTLLALESTVIAHGLPYPQNLETARELEAMARAHGVQPRTIAVLHGEVRIGLSDGDLAYLAEAKNVLKLARRDIAYALVAQRDGATTVSATMFLAHRAGIRVFGTGGLGGVHRMVDSRPLTADGKSRVINRPIASMDISADLTELASTPVAVVCAGAKAILDLPATLEFLETHSVPVLGFQTDEFPAFYSRSSGLKVSARVDSIEEAANVIRKHWQLGNARGVLVAVPIPADNEIPRHKIEPSIERALQDAAEQGITGNAVTPYLLRRQEELTQGMSVRSNIALLKNNVAVAAEIARALDRLEMPVI